MFKCREQKLPRNNFKHQVLEEQINVTYFIFRNRELRPDADRHFYMQQQCLTMQQEQQNQHNLLLEENKISILVLRSLR